MSALAETFRLPWPPSVNHYWHSRRDGKGKFMSAEGRAYREQVGWLCKQLTTWGTRRIAVFIEAFPPDRRKRDLDNIAKAPLDALMCAGLYKDDAQIDELRIRRGHVMKEPCLLVEIRAL